PEEHRQVGTLGELLEQIIVRLQEGQSDSPLAGVESARDLEELALDHLRRWCKRHHRPLLVVLENLVLLLHRKLTDRPDQRRLREVLMRDAPFVLVATATSYLEATTREDAPFYDFFHTLRLEDLGRDDVVELIEARARWDQEEGLLAQLEKVRARVD